MKIPKKLKIGGHIYKIDIKYRYKERADRYGHSDHAMKDIKVTDVDTNGKIRERSGIEETFIHEMLHCIDEVYNGNDLKEEQVLRMGQGLYQVLKDNKLLR